MTGAAGFVGGHLVRALVDRGDSVTAIIRPGELAGSTPAEWRVVELLDGPGVLEAIRETRPDEIYHLAGQSSVARSWQDPVGTYRANIEPLVNLLEAVIAVKIDPAILSVGSNEVYGAAERLPTNEDSPVLPTNPYAASKAAADLVALQYHLSHALRCVRVRPFNHIGPGQAPDFVVSSFARQIALIESGQQEPAMRVGNLDAVRDFTDVAEMLRAYLLALQSGEPGAIYNLGSGRPVSIRYILDCLLAMASRQISVEVDKEKMRPLDVPVTSCDSSKFQARTGWQASTPLSKTLGDILADWRMRVRERA